MAQPTLQDLQKEIRELIAKTGTTAIDAGNVAGMNLQQAQDAVKLLRNELREMGTDLDYIKDSFKDTLNELSKQNTYLISAKGALRSISSIASQVLEHKKGESTLDTNQITKLKHKAKLQFDELKIAIQRGRLQGKDVQALEDSLAEKVRFNKELDRTLQVEQKVNKEIGLAGVALKGFANLMSKAGLGDLSKPFADAIDKTKDARRQIEFYRDAIKELEKNSNRTNEEEEILKSHRNQVKELSTQTNKYKNIVASLKEQLTLVNLIDGAVAKIVSEYFNVNKAAVDYQRLTGQNATATAGINSNLATSAQVLETMAELTKQTGMAAGAIFSSDDLGRLTEAKNLLGLSAEQAGNLGIRSKLAGKSIEDYEKGIVDSTNNYNQLNNNAISHGLVMQDVLSVSDDIALAMGNSDKNIAKAAASARSLGLSLEKVDSIADSMMNFEESIGNELEAQLLTGKNINLSKARELALNNDLKGVANELAKNGASAAEFSKMNRIQQESLAKALGMSKSELAKMVMMGETAKNLTAEQRAEAMGVSVEQLKQMDIQQKIQTSLAKLAQAFAPILDAMVPILDAIVSTVGPVAKMVASLSSGIAPFVKYLGIGYGILKGTQLTLGAIAGLQTFITAAKSTELGLGLSILANLGFQNAAEMYKLTLMTGGNTLAAIRAGLEQTILGSIIAQGAGIIKNIAQLGIQLAVNLANAAAALTANAALTFGVGVAIAVGAALAGYAAIKAITADDMVSSPPGYGKRTLMGPEGAIALNDKDTVVAGTDLFTSKEQNKSIGGVVNMSPVVSEIQGLRSDMLQLIELVRQGTTINLDGSKIATSVNRNLPKVRTVMD
jgi:hypothetical protein